MEKIWVKNYPKGVPMELTFGDDTLVTLFDKVCKSFPSKPSLACHGTSLTFDEVSKYVDSLAMSLINLGIKKGDKVAVIMPNLIQYPLSIFAILKVGGVVVNVNPLYTANEMEYIIQNAEAKAAIVLDMMANKLDNIAGMGDLKNVIVTKVADVYPVYKRILFGFVLKYVKKLVPNRHYKGIDFRELLSLDDVHLPKIEITKDDLAFIQYTGATTGRPKGAMLSHYNVASNVKQIHVWLEAQVPDLSRHIVIDALPLYHIFSLTANLFAFFFAGSENVMITNPRDTKDVAHTLSRTPFTIFNGLDTLFNHLLNSKEFLAHKYPTYKYGISGGMATRDTVATKWHEVTGVTPGSCYGLTETSPAISMCILNDGYEPSVGYPIPSTEVDIRDLKTNESLNVGEVGVICVKGPQVSSGYWKNPEQTAKSFKDGWFRTGDLGYIDAQGKLYISGRESELIIVSGFNVYPAELEDVLDKIPQVKECAVIGIPNLDNGEQVVAYLSLRAKQIITKEEVQAKCREELAAYKIPRQVIIVDELPKTLVGKVDKKVLKQMYLEKGSTNGA